MERSIYSKKVVKGSKTDQLLKRPTETDIRSDVSFDLIQFAGGKELKRHPKTNKPLRFPADG